VNDTTSPARQPKPAGHGLLLIAHGSARYADAGEAVLDHAATIRAQRRFAAVSVGFLSGRPSVAEAIEELDCESVSVVPFFMEDGYFTQVAVPQALGGRNEFRLCPPVGSHPGLTDLIRTRIDQLMAGHQPDDIVLIGHGSARSPGRRLALHDHAERLGARVAFLEEPPSIADALAAARGPTVAIIGVFAGAGGHVRDDLPAAVKDGRRRLCPGLVDLGSIGDDPGMVSLILDRAAHATQR
jgi:sirohydrochlorin cobaltochelatase